MLKKIINRHQKKAEIAAARLNEQLNCGNSSFIIPKKVKGSKKWELILS